MKRFLSVILTIMLSVSLVVPEFVMPQVSYAESEKAGAYTYDPYLKVMMTDLYENGQLVLPESMTEPVSSLDNTPKVKVTKTKYGNGILLNGKVADLQSGRIRVGNGFDFSNGEVGRISFDGLKDRDVGMTVTVDIYLDDAEEPAATVNLRKQTGKKEWASSGEQSIDLIGNELSGKHNVSIGFTISGKGAGKKTSIALRSIEFCKTTLPVMYFNIDESEGSIEAMNNSEDHSKECYGTVDLKVPDAFNADETFRDEYSTQTSLTGLDLEYIRGRGNSTWWADKKPYKVKFDKAQDLFGFGSNKHWVLLANRYDNSLVRNRMTYWLGARLEMEYTPQCVPVEVVMNGEYYGSYLLCEQIRIGEGRVTIDDLDKLDDAPAATDTLLETGGYLLSMDWGDEEEPEKSFVTKQGMNFYVESPEDNLSYFRNYIVTFVQKVEDAIFGEGFKSADGHSYMDMLDIDTAVDYWWVQEFSMNGDAYGSGSTYLYKKRDPDEDNTGKLYWGPLWDFDYVAWGDLDYSYEPDGTLTYTSNAWFNKMLKDKSFVRKVKARWEERRGIKVNINKITQKGGLLDKYLKQMETSYIYDHEKWGSYESEITEYSGEIEQLRSWIIARTRGVDEAIDDLEAREYTVTFIFDDGTEIERKVCGGDYIADIPEAPEKEGYVFSGWYSDDYGYVTEDTEIYSDVVLTADYIDKEDIVEAKAIYFASYDVYQVFWPEDYEETTYESYYRVMPAEAFATDIKWSSSDTGIATVDNYGNVTPKAYGDVTIKAVLSNGTSNSYRLHLVEPDTMFNEAEYVEISKESLTLKPGEYTQLVGAVGPQPCYSSWLVWISSDENVADVDDFGIVTAHNPGTTTIMVLDTENRLSAKCKVTVKDKDKKKEEKKKEEKKKEEKKKEEKKKKSLKGTVFRPGGNQYKIISVGSNKKVELTKAKNTYVVTIPATVKYKGVKYNVTKIKAGAFRKSKATKIVVKTKKLTKKSVRNSLKGSKVKTVKVKVGSNKLNRTYLKKYKKYFTKSNAGKKVKVIAAKKKSTKKASTKKKSTKKKSTKKASTKKKSTKKKTTKKN